MFTDQNRQKGAVAPNIFYLVSEGLNMDFNGNSEVIRALKSKLASAYPGFVYVRVGCMGGEAKRYGLAYMRTGLLAAGEVD